MAADVKNNFKYKENKSKWKEMQKDKLKPLLNKTISGLYSPGSTIKPIVALSALENDLVRTDMNVGFNGKIEMYGHTYHCWKKKGHGNVTLKNAIKQSCDIYFYELARILGVDRLNITANKFGFFEDRMLCFPCLLINILSITLIFLSEQSFSKSLIVHR